MLSVRVQVRLGLAVPAGQGRRHEADDEKDGGVQADRERFLGRRAAARDAAERRQRVRAQRDGHVEDARQAGDGKGARPGEDEGGRQHGEHVERDEARPRAAAGGDDGADERHVERELEAGEAARRG